MNILKKTYKYGFTLVELLVVITVIAILASVSFKAASVMSQKTAAARTSKRLAEISNCLADYYAEFGQYPPANGVEYEDWDEGWKPDNWDNIKDEVQENDPDFGKYKEDAGLMYYFRKKMSPEAWDKYSSVIGVHSYAIGRVVFASGDVAYTNKIYRIHDAYDQNIVYICEKPYTSYKLYSEGTTDGPEDDIYAGQKY